MHGCTGACEPTDLLRVCYCRTSCARVGEEGGATVCMMRNLEIERVVLAAMAVGIARRSLQVKCMVEARSG
mgnify:CR=1 FL=1